MNVRGNAKDTKYRIAIISAFPQKGVGKNGVPLTGYNVTLRAANDTLTKKDIQAGKGQTAPMLAYNKYEKDGKEAVSNAVAYSKDQYDAMMAAANTKGDKPVIEASVFPKKGALVVNTKDMQTPKKAYDHAKDLANTEAVRDVKAKTQQKNEAQMAAEAEKQGQMEAPEQDGPEMG